MHWTISAPISPATIRAGRLPAAGPITKDNTGIEVYDTIFSVVESPLQKDMIWTGSDDGLVQLTTDGGKNWTNVTPKALPEWGTVSMIEASPHSAGTAYVAVERHRMTTARLTSSRPRTQARPGPASPPAFRPTPMFTPCVKNPKRQGLLYAGTEKGVFVSFDDGANWQSLQLNLPVSPVNDLIVHDKDLVVATHGRAFWILDDVAAAGGSTRNRP